MLQKNELYEAEITGMTTDGSGVCRIGGMAVFVPLTAVGDLIRVRIVKVLKSYAFGIIDTIITPSPQRQEPDCPVFRQCGGCVFRHVTYEEELRYKEAAVRDSFKRIGGISPQFEPIIGAESRCGYRNKAQYPVTMKDGKLVCGFYARHSHRVIPYTHCPLQPLLFGKILEYILPRLQDSGIHAYDEETGKGLLRHIYIRQGWHSGEISLCFVVTQSIQKHVKSFLPLLSETFPKIVSITENINPDKTNVILGKTIHTLAGQPVIRDIMCGNIVELSPLSFYQINTVQAEKLYAVGKDLARLHGDEILLDLYCGTGTIGLSMANSVRQLIGVEIITEAVKNARINARRNGIQNAEFHCGDAGKIAAYLQSKGMVPDVIILDPPRKGCDHTVIQAAADMRPDRIVMISCNPATAARDAAAFTDLGYTANRVQAVDLFPGTGHVECVVLMSRAKA